MSIALFINEPIGGLTDRTDYLHADSQASFQLIRGSRGPCSIPLIVFAGDAYEAAIGSPVYLYEIDDEQSPPVSECVWAGTIDNVSRKWLGDEGYHIDTLSCASLEQSFDVLKVPARAYFDQTPGYIVRDLFTTVAAGVPVAIGTIEEGVLIGSPGVVQTIPSMVFHGDESLNDAFTTLATMCGFLWFVRHADQKFYFQAPSTTPAPFALASTDMLYETPGWEKKRADYRNRQLIRISPAAFGPSVAVFVGDGTTTDFDLPWPADNVISAVFSEAFQRARPSNWLDASQPGDTITIGDLTYTYVDALDNRIPFQILTGDAETSCRNLADAVNAEPAYAGVRYSLPTWENGAANAWAIGEAVQFRIKLLGATVESVTMTSAAGGRFAFGSPSPYTGVVSLGDERKISISGSGSPADVSWQQGSTRIVCATPPAGGDPATVLPLPPAVCLWVTYYRLGSDIIAVEDTAEVIARAAAEHGTGKYQQCLAETQCADARAALLRAQKTLETYSALPSSFSFQTDHFGLLPGELLTIAVTDPDGASAWLDGDWIVQEVNAVLLPGMNHFRYTVQVSTDPIVSYVNFWENLALTGKNTGSGGGLSGAGSGAGAAATKQWVQEVPRGTKNGYNARFTLTWVPRVSNMTALPILVLAKNGVELTPFPYTSPGGFDTTYGSPALSGEYTVDQDVITFAVAPNADDYLVATYLPGVGTPQKGVIKKVEVAVITSFDCPEGFPELPAATWEISGGSSDSVLPGGDVASYTAKTDTVEISISGISDLPLLSVKFWLGGVVYWDEGSPFIGGLAQVHDVCAKVTYGNLADDLADIVVYYRPTEYNIVPGTYGDELSGTVNPPGGTIFRFHQSSFTDPSYLVFSAFDEV